MIGIALPLSLSHMYVFVYVYMFDRNFIINKLPYAQMIA